MTLDLKKDREIAEAATLGPWEWDGKVWDFNPDQEAPWLVCGPKGLTPVIGGSPEAKQVDANHIAHFNPSHAIEYIDTIEKQALAIEVMRQALESIQRYGYPSRRGSRLGLVDEFDSHIDLSRTALSQAREILDEAVSEKGDE